MTERKVLHRDRQELQAADLNNMQEHVQVSLDHLVIDGITDAMRFVGLSVTQAAATEVDVTTGRVYETGRVYVRDTASRRDLLNLLPVASKRIVTVVAYGNTTTTQVEPRDFLVNLEDGTTEPQSVPMQEWRRCEVDFIAGNESAQPVAPAVPANAVRVADIVINTTQIVSINTATENVLPSVESNVEATKRLSAFNRRISGRVDGLQSNLLDIGRKQQKKLDVERFIELTREVASLRSYADRLQIQNDQQTRRLRQISSSLTELQDDPPPVVIYRSEDHYLDKEDSDFTPVDSKVVMEEGLRFPTTSQQDFTLTLYNAADLDVMQIEGGKGVIAVYEDEKGLTTPQWGETQQSIALGQYTYYTHSIETRTRTRERIRYGDWRRVCTNGARWSWNGGRAEQLHDFYDAEKQIFELPNGETWEARSDYEYWLANGIHKWMRARKTWRDTVTEQYNVRVRNKHTIPGTEVAQTFIVGSQRYITQVGIWLDELGTQGGITMVLCYADEGEPALKRGGLATVSYTYDQLKVGQPTYFAFSPTLVEPDRRYAVVLLTEGGHKVRVEPGSDVLDGTLMYLQDGTRYQKTDANGKSQCLSLDLNFASFANTRPIVRLNDLELTGGIYDVDILYGNVKPEATGIEWELLADGFWKRIPSDNAVDRTEGMDGNILAQGPSTLPLRTIMNGSRTLMPLLEMGDNTLVRISRHAETSFIHYSKGRVLGQVPVQVTVREQIAYFDAAVHTLDVKLVDTDTGTEIAPTAFYDVIVDDAEGRLRRTFQFVTEGGTTQNYQIKTVGTRASINDTPFIVEMREDSAEA